MSRRRHHRFAEHQDCGLRQMPVRERREASETRPTQVTTRTSNRRRGPVQAGPFDRLLTGNLPVSAGLKALHMQSVFGDADAPIVVELAQNQIYKAFREVGRVMRTVAAAVPRRLEAAGTGDRGTNKAEAYNGFSAWTPNQGVIAENDPAEQESRSNGTRCCAT
jgi:hypothetical protein